MASPSYIYEPSVNTPVNLNPSVLYWAELGINSSSNMTVSFIINISANISNPRNIFHVTNNNTESSRAPSIWIGDYDNDLNVCCSTPSESYAYFPTPAIPLNTPTQVQVVFSGQTIYVYINNSLVQTNTFEDIVIPAIDGALFYICDPWWSIGDFTIENFYMYNGNAVSVPFSNLSTGLQYYMWNNNNGINYGNLTNFTIFNTNSNGSGTVTSILNYNDSNSLYNEYGVLNSGNFVLKFTGYFIPNQTGTWGFVLGDSYNYVSNDDLGVLWIGDNALNPSPNNYTGLCTYFNSYESTIFYVELTASQAYPLLMYYGNFGGGFVIALGIIPPGGVVTYDGTPYYKYGSLTPQLTDSDFSNEYFSNYYENKNNSNNNNQMYYKYFILLFVIILLICILFYR